MDGNVEMSFDWSWNIPTIPNTTKYQFDMNSSPHSILDSILPSSSFGPKNPIQFDYELTPTQLETMCKSVEPAPKLNGDQRIYIQHPETLTTHYSLQTKWENNWSVLVFFSCTKINDAANNHWGNHVFYLAFQFLFLFLFF